MDIKQQIEQALIRAVEAAVAEGILPEGAVLPPVLLEEPPEKELGDFATNFAMQSARVFRQSPQKIAAAIRDRLAGDWLDHAEVAGPGFLNLYLKKTVLSDTLRGRNSAHCRPTARRASRWSMSVRIRQGLCTSGTGAGQQSARHL